MKKTYEKPSIVKLQSGLMNKFGSSPAYARKIRTHIDNVSIEALIATHGSPLFVFSEKKLREQYKSIYQAFSTRYPKVTLGWSYKTNYLQAICAALHQEGAIAEVVSAFEYEKARKLGVKGDKIIFNGPHKSFKALQKAVDERAMIHIDHLDEIYDLEKIAQSTGRTVPVAIRLNMNTGIYPQWSRFGFNVESGQALDAVKRIVSGKKLIINGLHCHIGTFIMDPDAYARQIQKMVEFGYKLQDEFGIRIEYFDIGGGFPSKNRLKGTYLPPEVSLSAVDVYAEKITTALYHALKPGDMPHLYLETGRAIVDEAGYLITTITAGKRLPDGRKAYIADAGVNLLFTAFWYKFNIEIDREVQGMNEAAVIYGPLCMNIDAIDEGTMIPPLNRGTRLIISPVGAYNQTQSMQFIEYRPASVMISESGEMELIREAEDLSDIERREKLPDRLKIV
ncbi:MAG: alanine racemase [SAR324 cluster bacterium]|nr:alanine racemase [SAR324 cluster bacterium]